jgi:predicted CXXCH cytochrome family protein
VNPDTREPRSRQLKRFFALMVVGGVLIFVGCSSATKHQWMSRFFDGVPPPGGATNTVAVATEDAPGTDTVSLVLPDPAEPVHVAASVHPPFADRSCAECHESKFSQKMKGPMNSVCFSCHDDFLEKMKVKHQPAEAGDCSSCHNPHESPNKKLLVRVGKAMCIECHDDPVAQGKVKHQPVESDCMECHSPHASNIKGLLKKPLAASCFDCHDDFLKEAKFKHDPAGNGECMSCHMAHQSDHKGLLLKPGSQLCFECHEQGDMAKVQAHQRTPETDCVQCHNPHAGSDKFFLKPALLKPTALPTAK